MIRGSVAADGVGTRVVRLNLQALRFQGTVAALE